MPLTKEDIVALRQSDSIVVYVKSGEAEVICIKKVKNINPVWQSNNLESRYTIKTEGIISDKYNKATFVSLYKNGGWQSLSLIVKPGDDLIFYASENNNSYIESAKIPLGALDTRHHGAYDHLHHDNLWVNVKRNNKYIVNRLSLDCSICPDNSARALQ